MSGKKTSTDGGQKRGNDFLEGLSSSHHVADSYEECMEALSSLITGQKRGDGSSREQKFGSMMKYVKILGFEEHINGLNIIHVAGTKGKGSTCAFCESILRECGWRTGLFTSPHLVDVRERYRIGGFDISEDKFLNYFWDCWKQLKVDVAIIEVGLGGRWDPTNVVKEPVVCGITSLGMDHMEILGNTLEKIASEKAGILKPRVPAFTVPQLSEAMAIIKRRAEELMIPLEVVLPLCLEQLGGKQLGLAGDHQLINAGLAVSLCKYWLHTKGHLEEKPYPVLPQGFVKGLSTATLPGRAHIVKDKVRSFGNPWADERSCGDLIFYLDGAHTPESMEVCVGWFSGAAMDNPPIYNPHQIDKKNGKHDPQSDSRSPKTSKLVLLFNCMETRDPLLLLPKLTRLSFSVALFVPSMSCYHLVTSASSSVRTDHPVDTSWQSHLQATWEGLISGKDNIVANERASENPENLLLNRLIHDYSPNNPASKQTRCCAAVMPSLPNALSWLRDCVKDNPNLRLQVLVTGSLHLVGDLLKLLRK
ncbi:folylpolyglutamate synthase-like isoform X2 [Wolffia australiana]